MPLLMESGALDRILEHVLRAHPEECCGALVGTLAGDERHVNAGWPLENVAADAATRFAIAPADYSDVERRAAAAATTLLGFYHSHPDGPAAPSATDLAHAWPFFSYLILAAAPANEWNVTSWRLSGDRSAFDREEIIVWQPGS